MWDIRNLWYLMSANRVNSSAQKVRSPWVSIYKNKFTEKQVSTPRGVLSSIEEANLIKDMHTQTHSYVQSTWDT